MKNIFKICMLMLTIFFSSCEEEVELTITPRTDFTLNDPDISAIIINATYQDTDEVMRLTWDDFSNNASGYTVKLATDEDFTNSIDFATTDTRFLAITFGEINQALSSLGINSISSNTLYVRVDKTDANTNSISFSVLSTTVALAPPVLDTPADGDAFVIDPLKEEDIIITPSWTFENESSVTITYDVQMALAGTGFAEIISLGTAEDTNSISLTTLQLNDFAVSAGLVAETAGDLDLRVKATFDDNGTPIELYSGVKTISVTPYDFALPPVLYVVGAGAVDAGWGWDSPVELVLQGSKWSGNINLSPDNGGNFRFFTDASQQWASPSYNFPYFVDRGYTIDSNFEDAMDGDNNFLFTGTAGQYFIEIDTDARTITLGPAITGPNCNFDQLWVVGAGAVDAGWNWDSPVKISCTGTGVYEGNINLTNDSFRFFTAEGDWSSGRNYPFYANDGYTIDANLEDALDGDNNFRFTGTPGEYGLTIDTVNKTITLGSRISFCDYDQLWLVGAATPGGWGWDAPTALPCVGAGIYSGDVTFTNESFRFFTAEGDWNSGLNYPHYVGEGYTIDAGFEDAMDGDNNFSYIGTPGTVKLTVDTNTQRIYIGEDANCDNDQLWLVGAATPGGWGWDAPTALPCTGNGVYSGEVTFTNEAFRFFTVEGDWNSGLNYPYYVGEGYTIDGDFEDAMDGDNNFSFIGTPGTVTLTVDTNNKTITLN